MDEKGRSRRSAGPGGGLARGASAGRSEGKMSGATEQRKLAAIMFTDMVGFSALSQRDEALALQLLEEHRTLIRAIVPRHGGREVKTIGDGFLLEFSSALSAVQSPVEIQEVLNPRTESPPPDRVASHPSRHRVCE